MKTAILLSTFLMAACFANYASAQEKNKETTSGKVETVKSPEKTKVNDIKNENKTNTSNNTEKITVTEEGTDSKKNNPGTNHNTESKQKPSLSGKTLAKPVKIDVNKEKLNETPQNKDKNSEGK